MRQEERVQECVQEECTRGMYDTVSDTLYHDVSVSVGRIFTTIEWRLYKLIVYSIQMLRFPKPCRKCQRNGCRRHRSPVP